MLIDALAGEEGGGVHNVTQHHTWHDDFWQNAEIIKY